MKEVFTAKNGRPYIKDENGRVKFISDKQAEEYLQEEEGKREGMIFVTALFIVLASILAASEHGLGLL
tara:strand:- start:284 stop:487 length:204 start_codon:yes stop_codon:yes gene_type:complete